MTIASCKAPGSSCPGELLERVIKAAHAMDDQPCDLWLLQRLPEFRYVMDHLDGVLADDAVRKSPTLAAMAWRAAFLFGTEAQTVKAFEVCGVECCQPNANLIARDLGLEEGRYIAKKLVLGGIAGSDAVARFLYTLSFAGPTDWSVNGDYTVFAEHILDHENDAALRAHAAFLLADWYPEGPEGRRAYGLLEQWAKSDGTARALLADLRIRRSRSLRREAVEPP